MITLSTKIIGMMAIGMNVVYGNDGGRNVQAMPWQPIPFGAFPPQPFSMAGGNEMMNVNPPITNAEGQFIFPQDMTEATVGEGSTGSMANAGDGSSATDRPMIVMPPPMQRPPNMINRDPRIIATDADDDYKSSKDSSAISYGTPVLAFTVALLASFTS